MLQNIYIYIKIREHIYLFIEYIFLDHFREKNTHVIISGNKNILNISRENPVIFVSGHFANFELMSMEITKKNIPLATIYRPLNNIILNPFFIFGFLSGLANAFSFSFFPVS